MQGGAHSIDVLHVDADPDVAAAAAAAVERADGRCRAEVVTTATEGLERLDAGSFDCVVSGYDLPDPDGVAFLEAVRERRPDLPFVLFTGAGSEALASEAISAGVTDYVRNGSDGDPYRTLADRAIEAAEAFAAGETGGSGDTDATGGTGSGRTVDWHRTVLRNMGEGVYVMNADYEIRFVRHRIREAEEVFDGDWVGRPLSYLADIDVLTLDDVARIRTGVDRVVDGERSEVRLEIEPLVPAATEVLELRLTSLELASEAPLVLGTTRDVTERKNREAEVQTTKVRYQTLVDNLPDGAVFLFDDDLRYTLAGGSELAAVGLSSDDFEGTTPHDLFPADIAAETERHYREALAGHASTYEQWFQGELYRVQTLPIRNAEGTVVSGMALSQRITDRRRRERKLERQNERLEEFAGIVSHDLRNPLNVAEGRLALAAEECESDHLAPVEDALDRMREIIGDTLALARQGRIVEDAERIQLSELLGACWRNVETADAELVVDDDLSLRGDPERLGRLFENLFRNAVEHGGPDVTVRVGALGGGGFYVEDDGPGIPAADRDRVFKPGHSTNDGGTGFGLSIAKEIVASHGWEIDLVAATTETGGARFEVTGVDDA
jgi:signal transduction histidine kinase/CheY-like chemotaxis protein